MAPPIYFLESLPLAARQWLREKILSRGKLFLATNNPHKLDEAREIIKLQGIKNLKVEAKKVKDLEEKQGTPEQIVAAKAIEAYWQTAREIKSDSRLIMPLVEDDSFEIEALGGFPGPYVSDLFKINLPLAADPLKLGCERLIKMVNGNNRKATVRSLLAFSPDGINVMIATGHCRGKIARQVKPPYRFGFDPIFIPKGYKKSFSQLDPRLKNMISHRALAWQKFLAFLNPREHRASDFGKLLRPR